VALCRRKSALTITIMIV